MNEILLAQRAIEGDHEAYRQLFQRYLPQLSRLSHHFICRPVQDIEDILQETFAVIMGNKTDLSKLQSFDAYVYDIARKKILTLHTREKKRFRWHRKHTASLDKTPERSDKVLLDKESEAILSRAIEGLSNKSKEAYLMNQKDGLSVKEIAQKLNLSESAVRDRLKAAMEGISRYLREHGEWILLFIWVGTL